MLHDPLIYRPFECLQVIWNFGIYRTVVKGGGWHLSVWFRVRSPYFLTGIFVMDNIYQGMKKGGKKAKRRKEQPERRKGGSCELL